jgi:hypothetical protein
LPLGEDQKAEVGFGVRKTMGNLSKALISVTCVLLLFLCWYGIVISKSTKQRSSNTASYKIAKTFYIVINQEHIISNRENPLREFVIQFEIRNQSNTNYDLPTPNQLTLKFGNESADLPISREALESAISYDPQISPGETYKFAIPYHGTALPKNISFLQQSKLEWRSGKESSSIVFDYQP